MPRRRRTSSSGSTGDEAPPTVRPHPAPPPAASASPRRISRTATSTAGPVSASSMLRLRSRLGRRLAVLAIFIVFAVVALRSWPEPPRECSKELRHMCPDGTLVQQAGPDCRFDCIGHGLTTGHHRKFRTELLWNAPVHSHTGVASEAIDFLIGLHTHLPNLALTGGFVEEYLDEYSDHDRATIYNLRHHADMHQKWHDDGAERPVASIYLTQYSPDTYVKDFQLHRVDTYDYRIGRAMFETSWIPADWAESCNLMDEIWVPSAWGRDVFARAGVDAHRLHVIPEAVDVHAFDPERVQKDPMLLPGCNENFSFLSVFKWEDRKNWDTLLRAFLAEFRASDNVRLFIRGGTEFEIEFAVQEICGELGIDSASAGKVLHIPKVTLALYRQLFATADAFVLPTHGEGWGRPIAEAMAMGLPTIVPDWSGHTAFATDANSFLVPVTAFEEAFPREPELLHFQDLDRHLWARVDVARLRKVMRYVVQNPSIARQVGQQARAHMVKHFSRKAVAATVLARLEAIHADLARRDFQAPVQPPPEE